MAISLKHLFQSAKTDGPDNTIVQPSDWNDEHVLTQATNRLLGRTTAGAGATEEIAPGTGITLSAGTLSADVTSVAGRTGAVTLSTADISGLTTGYVQKTSATGSAYLPAGTTGQREGSPAAGYIRYNTTTGKFEGYGSAWGNIGGGASIGDTPPANPGAGDLWWNSADGRMYVYYTDANSSQWVDLSAGGAGQYLPLTGGTVTGTLNLSGALVTTDGTSTTRVLNSGGAGIIGTQSNHPLVVQTNNAERLRIDTSGNVGIGTLSPAFRTEIVCSDNNGIQVKNTGGTTFGGMFVEASAMAYGTRSNTAMRFITNDVERARLLTGGQFVINGTQERGRQTIYWDSNTQQGLTLMTTSSTFNGSPIIFLNGAAGVSGFIGQSGGAVSYNTSSDYRLKEAVHPLSSGLSTICALNPVRYKWKTDGTDGEGFIAHELQNVVPLAVVGEKDAVNLDGSIKPQGVDYSKIVVHLVSAIQELNAKVNALQSEITVLKGGE